MKKLILAFLVLLFIPLVAGASIDTNLYYGLRNNSDVRELQELLIDKGFLTGSATGNFLSLTLKAVKQYQASEGIIQTGYVGTLTRTAINNDLATQLSASNAEATTETGTTPPAPAPQATTNDVVRSLQDQIALLLQQVQAMQAQQISVQQLQQTVQQQAETINQIQQNTQQIAQNTNPVCTPNWSCSNWSACQNYKQTKTCADSNNCGVTTNKPHETQSCEMKIYSSYSESGLGRIYKVSPIYPEMQDVSNYIQLSLVIRNESGEYFQDKIVEVVTTDSSQNKTINGTPLIMPIYTDGYKKVVPAYGYYYKFNAPGKHTITFSSSGMSTSVDLDVNP